MRRSRAARYWLAFSRVTGKSIEVRSPLPGRINKILKPNGSQVARDEEVLNLISDEDSVWEALRGLALDWN